MTSKHYIEEAIEKNMSPKKEAIKLLASATKLPMNQIASTLEVPPDSDLGDLAFPCFVLSKQLKKAPNQIASELASKLKSTTFKVQATGPYLNFFFDKGKFVKKTITKIDTQGSKYGHSNKGKNKKLLIEHTSTNPSGPTNIGRIRNSFIGDTLVRLHKAIGYNVKVHYYVNDLGKQIAIIAWGIKNKIAPDKFLMQKYKKYANNPDFKVFFTYVPSNALVQDTDPYMEQVDEMLAKSETDNKIIAEMHKVAKSCLDGQKKTLARFGIKFDKFDFESPLVKKKEHMKYVNKLMARPEYIDLDGAKALNLSKYGLARRSGGTVFMRASGAAVYMLKDLAYHEYKLKLADYNINVLGEDHKIEAAELTKILELLGVLTKKKKLDIVHLSFVNLKKGRLSTRRGETVPADVILDIGVEKVEKVMVKQKLPKATINKIAEKVAASAIRYSQIKIAPMKSILFDWDEALSFEGDTGPYLQYALVRAKKILKKAKGVAAKPNDSLSAPQEFELAKKLAKFPEVILEAAEQYAPHKLANYAFKLCKFFSTFYEACPVLKAESAKLKSARLALVQAFSVVLANALDLLGIEQVEMM